MYHMMSCVQTSMREREKERETHTERKKGRERQKERGGREGIDGEKTQLRMCASVCVLCLLRCCSCISCVRVCVGVCVCANGKGTSAGMGRGQLGEGVVLLAVEVVFMAVVVFVVAGDVNDDAVEVVAAVMVEVVIAGESEGVVQEM